MDHTKLFEDRLKKLNQEQRRAVEETEGPVMVLAGPGTGKTEIIGMRAANIVKKSHIDPKNILIMTFTESGVKAIKTRLAEIMGPAGYGVNVSTFHGFCNQIISEFPEKFIFARSLKRITDLEAIDAIRSIIDDMKPEHLSTFGDPYYYLKGIRSALSNLKRENVSPDQFESIVNKEIGICEMEKKVNKKTGKPTGAWSDAYARLLKNKDLVSIYRAYSEQCKKSGWYDFDDMVMFVIDKLENDDTLLAVYQERYLYVLVDEYQDTNSAQNRIIELLASFEGETRPNVFVVGDDDQSIYRFQGASLENILFFNKKFVVNEPIVLKHNYRSLQHILDASADLIENNTHRASKHMKDVVKSLVSKKGQGSLIRVIECPHEHTEKHFVATEIKQLIEKGVHPSDIAVLARKNSGADEYAEFLSRMGIPVVVAGTINVLTHPVMRLLIDYLTIIASPYDDQTLAQVMMSSATKINPVDVYKISMLRNNVIRSDHKDLHIWSVMTKRESLERAEVEGVDEIELFVKNITKYKERAASTSFARFFEEFLRESGFMNWVEGLGDERIEALRALSTLYSEVKSLNKADHSLSLEKFLKIVSLYREHDIALDEEGFSIDRDGVYVSTAHKSKGLEFEHVFIVEAVDGAWGNTRDQNKIHLPASVLKNQNVLELDKNEDERRLFFVAMTRAKEQVHITYSHEYGSGDQRSEKTPTQFLLEIRPDRIEKINIGDTTSDLKEFFDVRTNYLNTNSAMTEKEYIDTILSEYKMSVTHLNAYIRCPRQFKYGTILRLPAMKDKHMALGTAYHKALENFFLEYKKDGVLPSKDMLLKLYEEALSREILTPKEFDSCKEEGIVGLSGYYDYYKDVFSIPEFLEYDFGPRDIRVDGIQITGKIDKIEKIKGDVGHIRVVDYKTGDIKSDNEIAGTTKNSDGSFKRQIVFYKLLCENDSFLKGNYTMTEGVLDFVQGKNEKYKQAIVPFDENDVSELKKTIKDVYAKIKNQEFPMTDSTKTCERCPYYNLCYGVKESKHNKDFSLDNGE